MASVGFSAVTDRDQDYLHNVLNEVLHGFSVNLPMQMQTDYPELLAFLNELDASGESYRPSSKQAAMLMRASHLCEAEFGESEFHTRLGFTKDEARQIEDQLRPIANQVRDDEPLLSRVPPIDAVLAVLPRKTGSAYVDRIR